MSKTKQKKADDLSSLRTVKLGNSEQALEILQLVTQSLVDVIEEPDADGNIKQMVLAARKAQAGDTLALIHKTVEKLTLGA